MDLDWRGSFRADSHFLWNPYLGSSSSGVNGFSSYGRSDAFFTLGLLRLQPRVLVNDNITINSDWWIGDPARGLFGSHSLTSSDHRRYNSNFVAPSPIRAHRIWADLDTDFGTFSVGRQPQHWGLGLVWNAGDDDFARYFTTIDGAKFTSSFGSFELALGGGYYSYGSSIAGACSSDTGAGSCTLTEGSGASTEISASLMYQNKDDHFSLGLAFIRRITQSPQSLGGYFGVAGTNASSNFNIFDIYAAKSFGPLSLKMELPITQGSIGGLDFNTQAVVLKSELEVMDSWRLNLHSGYVPGQSSVAAAPTSYSGFALHPNYKLGLFLFQYAFHNFANVQTNESGVAETGLSSPFDNPVSNAVFFQIGSDHKIDRFDLGVSTLFALAPSHAKAGSSGDVEYFAASSGQFTSLAADAPEQSNFLGAEVDFHAGYNWDQNTRLGLDFGFLVPGGYFAFSNSATALETPLVFGGAIKLRVNF